MAPERSGKALAGFVVFAGLLLMVVGLINVFQGLVALAADEPVPMAEDKLVIVNLTAWGWFLVIYGLIMMAVGAGLLMTQTWARITGIILICLHAVAQIAWLGAYPVWSVLMIALDVVVLYALTMRWSDVQDRLGDPGEPSRSGADTGLLSAAERGRPPGL